MGELPPHAKYTGQDVFFPVDKKVSYRLRLLNHSGTAQDIVDALLRFYVTVANMNEIVNDHEENYTMLVHTSGRTADHDADRLVVEQTVHSLSDSEDPAFDKLVEQVHTAAITLYPAADADQLTSYVVQNASRSNVVALNSTRDRKAAGDNPTEPSSPFTVIVGGNIVSRGVTFPNLLSMFFTRDVKQRLQQDTYIQRARMFGARGAYLEHFELTIPTQLYTDWHRCFIFHRLALATINAGLGSPVWISDKRVAVAADASVDKSTVAFDKGEMSFNVFKFDPAYDDIVKADPTSADTLVKLQAKLGESALPTFLIDYIRATLASAPGLLAIHTASSIAKATTANQKLVSRAKGFIGKSQREEAKFPGAMHHVKILFNADGDARLFYKYQGSAQFIQNLAHAPVQNADDAS